MAAIALTTVVVDAILPSVAVAKKLPDWTLAKTASPTTYSHAGQTITYTYVLTSNSGSPGTLAGIKDDRIGAVNCPTSVVPSFGKVTCTGSYVITAADIANGSVTNTATATGDSCNEGCVQVVTATATVRFVQPSANSSITIVKTAVGGDGTFSFSSSNAALPSFSLTTSGGSATYVASNLPAGSYSITEASSTGWKLDSLSCTGSASTTNVSSRTATVQLAAGANVTCTFSNSETGNRTKNIIRNFMSRRADLLTADNGRPRLIERTANGNGNSSGGNPMQLGATSNAAGSQIVFGTSLSRLGAAARQNENARLQKLGGPLGISVTDTAVPPARPGFDVWVEGRYTNYDYDIGSGSADGDFGLFRVGADYLLQSWMLVGVLAQFDSADETSTSLGYRIKGHGWMAGPYAEFRLSDNVIFDAKGLWGQSTNDVSPFLTYTDTFDTDRWLVSARLTGTWVSGNWNFSPRAEIIGYEERQESYIDSNGFAIGEQTFSMGRAIAGPEVSYRYSSANGGLIEPRVGIKGLWTFNQSGASATSGASVAYVGIDDFDVRLEAGIKFQAANGARVEISAEQDGVASGNFDATSGNFQLTFPLN